MSLAVLARKTRAKQKLKKRGKFILNMTGRGNVLGMNAKMSRGNCKGLTTCAGKRAACCVGTRTIDDCPPTVITITSTMGVEFNPAGGTNLVYGFVGATSPNGPTGTLLPALEPSSTFSVGDSSGTMIWQQTNPGVEGQFGILFDPAGQPPVAPDNLFVSISFTNSNGTRTYNVADATQKPSITGNNNFLWNFGGAGEPPYAPENSFWQDSSGVATAVTMTTNGPCEPKNRACCEFPHGGQPAPQQGYRVYLNRKSKGAYRPAGGKQCKTLSGCTSAKSVWKQGSNLDAGEITRKRRDNTLACYTDVYTAKKDTCTGCPTSSTTNTMVVGSVPSFYGFGTSSFPTVPFGTLTSQNVNGVAINSILYSTLGPSGGLFAVALGGAGLTQTFFTSISIVDGNNVRTYSTANVYDFTTGATYAEWRWDATASGYSDELAYWSARVGTSLGVIFDGTLGKKCCCPVKKNICGCRATDLVRYTRINKSFGCQTTKAVRMGRTASEQIARRRAAVDCIAPKHRTIYIDIISNDGLLKVNGCCGNQCLIQGQQYTFVFNQVITPGQTPFTGDVTIQWCQGVEEKITSPADKSSFSFTVPKFNKNCQPATEAVIKTQATSIRLSYCKKAFKTPQMLGSCSGR